MTSRIAPTPSGYLHLGNAYNFLLTEKLVRDGGGRLRLRIDDGDAGRMRPEYVDDIFESLRWLGIEWEEGPRNREEQETLYSQTLQGSRYRALLERLAGRGWLYACTCSRKEIAAAAGPDGQYAGSCSEKELPLDTPGAALRLRTPPDAVVGWEDGMKGSISLRPWDCMRDFVVWRRDGAAAYQLATVADDLAYRITTIVRGEDLLPSTAAQLWLASCAEEPQFETIRLLHHPLLQDESGKKLSKSAGSTSLEALREAGLPASQLRSDFQSWTMQFLRSD